MSESVFRENDMVPLATLSIKMSSKQHSPEEVV